MRKKTSDSWSGQTGLQSLTGTQQPGEDAVQELQEFGPKLNAMIANSIDAFAILDRNGVTRYVSSNVERLFGWLPDDVVGSTAFNRVHQEDREHMQKALAILLIHPNATMADQCRFLCKDGSFAWIRAAGVNMMHNPDIAGILLNFHNITERKQAEMELKRYHEHLEELVTERTAELRDALAAATAASRAKNTFLTAISHELRTPLNAILGFANLLARDLSLSSVNLDKVNTIKKSGESLLESIIDILEMSRIEAGQSELHEQGVDLHNLLEELAILTCRLAKKKELVFAMDVAANLPRYVVTDPDKMCQVMYKLLSNAIKFTSHGSVELRAFPAELDRVAIEVKDTGVGISAEDIPILFRPFEQVGSGLSSHTAGVGLGLAISRKYARQMGGDIYVESHPGEGSCFRFEFSAPLTSITSVTGDVLSTFVPPTIGSESEAVTQGTPAEKHPSRAIPTLEKMTTEWREKFRQALARKNITRIRELGKEVNKLDPALSSWLLERVGQYDMEGLEKLNIIPCDERRVA